MPSPELGTEITWIHSILREKLPKIKQCLRPPLQGWAAPRWVGAPTSKTHRTTWMNSWSAWVGPRRGKTSMQLPDVGSVIESRIISKQLTTQKTPRTATIQRAHSFYTRRPPNIYSITETPRDQDLETPHPACMCGTETFDTVFPRVEPFALEEPPIANFFGGGDLGPGCGRHIRCRKGVWASAAQRTDLKRAEGRVSEEVEVLHQCCF